MLGSGLWLVRILFLRCFFFIYSVAFLVSLRQNEALLGDEGLTPARRYWQNTIVPRFAAQDSSSLLSSFMSYPSLFWLIGPPSTASLNMLAAVGLLLSVVITVLGAANMFMILAIWLLMMTIQSVGQTWFSFGWESQLLEMTFLTAFMCPFLSLSAFPKATPMPLLCIVGFRWLLFRIMLGAGLIKIRGDSCWRDLTAMHYHYETQPVPNFLSPFFHTSPALWHKFETLSNHVIELACPVLLLFPTHGLGPVVRSVSIVGGMIQVIFQFVLICSGNLSFLNWLTAIPAICCFDDEFVAPFFSPSMRKRAREAAEESKVGADVLYSSVRALMYLGVFALLAALSYPVVVNLLSSRQAMNRSFSAFKLVNTYGAFGSITRERHEVVLLGTKDDITKVQNPEWKAFEFPAKPTDPNRTSPWISPYHFRLDWLLWFAAFQSYTQCPWLVSLVYKLLQNDALVTRSLLSSNPFFESGTPPKYIKAELFLYKYALVPDDKADKEWERGSFWKRRHVREYLPPIALDNPSLLTFLKRNDLL